MAGAVATLLTLATLVASPNVREAMAQGAPPTYQAASGLPSFRLSQPTATVTPASAQSHYGSPTSPAAPARGPRLSALARALESDPDRIYQFVRNGVAFEPQFGLHKGAEGVWLDRSGGAFDQAQLMIDLLREAGYSARYVLGTVNLGPEAAQILRVDNARQACMLLAAAGTPATVNGQTACGSVTGSITAISMTHLWVEAQIGGSWYAFDPALKSHEKITGINLWSAAGVTATGAWNAVSSGVSTGQRNLTGLNQSGIAGTLTGYATTLQNALATSHHGAGLTDLAGGWRIVPVEDEQRLASLPGRTVTARWTGDVPAPYRATVRLEAPGLDHTYDLASIYAYRVQMQMHQGTTTGTRLKVAVRKCDHINPAPTAYFSPEFGLTPCETQNTTIGSTLTAGQVSSWAGAVQISINHPYAASGGTYADETVSKIIEIGRRADLIVRTAGSDGFRYAQMEAASGPLQALRVIPEGNPYECEVYGGPGPDTPITPDTCNGFGAEDWRYWIQDNPLFSKGEVAAAEMGSRKDQVINLWSELFERSSRLIEGLSGGRVFHQHTLGVSLTPSYLESVLDIDTAVGIAPGGTDQPHHVLTALAAVASAQESAALFQIASERASGASPNLVENAGRRLMDGSAVTVLHPGESTSLLRPACPRRSAPRSTVI